MKRREREEKEKSWWVLVLSEQWFGVEEWVFLWIGFGGEERERDLGEEKPFPSFSFSCVF